MNTLAWAIAATLSAVSIGAGAASPTIYEWVDASGRKQASDTVPDRYKAVARRVDPGRSGIPAAEQQKAERQAETLKDKAARADPAPLAASGAARPGQRQATSMNGGLAAPESAECAAWRRQIAANRDCFVATTNRRGNSVMRSCSNEPDPQPPAACTPASPR